MNNKYSNNILTYLKEFNENPTHILEDTKFILESFAKEYDYKIQEKLYKELIIKYAALAKDLEDKVNEITLMSITDQLTGIYNRRKIMEEFERCLDLLNRYQSAFSLILFDIDNFKKVNDNYGHDVGDIVLQNISSEVKKHIRKTDIFGRWGGEEFLILLPETNIEKCINVAEHVRKSIENINQQGIPKITCSLGAVEASNNEMIEQIIKNVDILLYKAKHNGKNRVEYKL